MQAGIYIHVPFCKSRCIYCDFYSTTAEKQRRRYAEAVKRELEARKDFLGTREIATVYLGGGTPSQLALAELEEIVSSIKERFAVAADAEITIEANPDDVTEEWCAGIVRLGFNRVSLGIQSFDDNILKFIRRRHTAQQAKEAVELLANHVGNISIDLIYGLPGQGPDLWESDLRQAFALPVKHLSAYALSIEEGAPLWQMVQQKKIEETDEETERAMYERLIDTAEAQGFEHYELSNFALPGYRSRHNSSYWHDVPYLGLGPGAHSYDGAARYYNRPDLNAYLAAPEKCLVKECLTENERFNDYVFTALRTADGLPLDSLAERFGEAAKNNLLRTAKSRLAAGFLELCGNRLKLTRKALFVSDDIISDLMLV